MSLLIPADGSVYLLVTGRLSAQALTATQSDALFKEGLAFRFAAPLGAIDLVLPAPLDLAQFADLSAAAILKPTCFPLTPIRLHHGVIHAELNSQPVAVNAAQLMRRLLAAV